MKRTTRVRLAGVGLLAALVGVACGDSDDNTETAAPRTERLTKAEFISQGDELCAGMNSRLDPIFGELFTSDGPPSGEQMQTALGEISEIIETTVADLKKLPVPAGDNAALAAIFTEVDASLGKIREAAGTPDGALALMESDDDPFAGANELFSEYGFEDCAAKASRNRVPSVARSSPRSSAPPRSRSTRRARSTPTRAFPRRSQRAPWW